ncbi:hypothetical protein BJ508DRAFT_411385 [Ascobolus immersus RN42]|uniref:Uncharacterized protein n=1 Tax=Ascobolus immersus RN42 TaxID=1160509 RepID=A0A3N4IPN6_ASCIM|nr:hypothetical protein BJ508DRAFT_411385 [Ascobolus immersus RN42]
MRPDECPTPAKESEKDDFEKEMMQDAEFAESKNNRMWALERCRVEMRKKEEPKPRCRRNDKLNHSGTAADREISTLTQTFLLQIVDSTQRCGSCVDNGWLLVQVPGQVSFHRRHRLVGLAEIRIERAR